MITDALKVIALLLISIPLLAHPGGLDANGGHTDKKTGTYHTHRAPASSPRPTTTSRPSSSSSSYTSTRQAPASRSTITLSPEVKERRLGDYFRNANAGLADKPIGAIHQRNVSEVTKRRVIARDGGKCVVCGSTVKLEVDHKVALMNGGTNGESNLATLCDDCHLAKTKMDGSLRRRRQKVR